MTQSITSVESDTPKSLVFRQSPPHKTTENNSTDSKSTCSPEDDEEEEILQDEVSIPLSQKRKRSIGDNNEEDEGDEEDIEEEDEEAEDIEDAEDNTSLSTLPSQKSPLAKRPRSLKPTRGVIVGVWRDSCESSDEKKHVVFGFIDIHDRLRTRLYPMNRQGEELIGNFPTAAGGYWVTSEKIIFDEHLRDLPISEIKEYIKIQQDPLDSHSKSEVGSKKLDHISMITSQASDINQDLLPASKQPNSRSLGASTRSSGGRQLLPREPMIPSPKALNTNEMRTPKGSSLGDGKFQGVPLGFWTESDGACDEDKHAVFGVLIGTDSFRVKVARQTRDGRHRDGNYPIGPGALWIHYDKVFFEPHLRSCSRPEVKEYCRIRLEELRFKESEEERQTNELQAVIRAKEIVAGGLPRRTLDLENINVRAEFENRKSTRVEQRRKSQQKVELDVSSDEAVTKSSKSQTEANEKKLVKTRRDTLNAETSVVEAAEKELKSNIKKLNKVWVAQQAITIPGVNSVNNVQSEIRYHNGIKYERKSNGPFQGKLVSPAQILTIDGEDFVEYRILTKPSFDY
ncbi:putative trna splicing endonuclease subunit [Erysiphe neolycopersici]|uniref:Putative trna splicing endonuclease subunit n=1 Tax=Erysiphe neolycopersici TaxID=212602 RepID=A0A420HRV0_9PEZI|nr:putative trna splicing endonuclease subunit [Erysiphe neolycopersici]